MSIIKRIIRWAFLPEFEKMENENYLSIARSREREYVAINALEQLGYELEYITNAELNPEKRTTHYKDMGWKLKKIPPPHPKS